MKCKSEHNNTKMVIQLKYLDMGNKKSCMYGWVDEDG